MVSTISPNYNTYPAYPHTKRWVVTDIHGCFDTFVELVEEKIQLRKSDILYLLGDYIDRGANSKGLIDYIIQLKDMGYSIVTLKGNHEDVLLRCHFTEKNHPKSVGLLELHDSWLYFGGNKTLRSFEINHASEMPEEYIRFFEGLIPYQILDDFVLVHAGLNFMLEDPFSDTLSMLWMKNFDIKPEKINQRQIIRGHVPTTLDEIEKSLESKVPLITLDNGCFYRGKKGMGNLVGLELNTFELQVQPNIDVEYGKASRKKSVV